MELISQSLLDPKLLKEEVLSVVKNVIDSDQAWFGVGWRYTFGFWDLTTPIAKEKDITFHHANHYMRNAMF